VSIAKVVIVMGVSGAGKTTVGQALAHAIGAEFHDADDYHPAANVEKMRAGVPLTDGDRAPWLDALRAESDRWLASGDRHVLACSALAAKSRRHLGIERPGVALVYLRATRGLVESRMRQRAHFMPASLAASQLATLEPPVGAIEVDAAGSPETLVAQIEAALEQRASANE
jgi:gluconokinase